MADIAKLIYKKNTLYGWESGDIKSSNDTYDDIRFLTQAEYDALPSKNPNTLYSTPEGWPAGFDSSNTKTFSLSWTSWATALSEAQDIYDWWHDGNNPVVKYTPEVSGASEATWLYFVTAFVNWDTLHFISFDTIDQSAVIGWWRSVVRRRLTITVNGSWNVTSIERNVSVPVFSYLSISSSNGTYTPSGNYDPATKKYVDDQVWDIATLLANI